MLVPIERSGLPDEKVTELKAYFGEYIDGVYKRADNVVIPYCYFTDFIWIHIFDLASLKEFQVLEVIEKETEKVQKLYRQKQFKELFRSMEKILMIPMFMEYVEEIPETDRYDIFQQIYCRSEYNFSDFTDEVLEAVFSCRMHSESWKNNMEKLNRQQTEDEIVIYRGEGRKSSPLDRALSWTTSEQVARHFATRFDEAGIVYQAKVLKKDVLCYLPDRNEEEVLVYPEVIYHIQKAIQK